MKKYFITIFFTLILNTFFYAQSIRYIDRIFPNVNRQTNLSYGVNATILYTSITLEAIPQQLLFDLYSPEADSLRERPLILYFHSGNFLPFPQNGSVSGTKTDSTVIEICTRLAKMGYVVASVDYRLGWDPINPSQTAKISGIINALYRGVQDANTCIRFFKKSYVEDGNPYGIDTSRIILWGQGTGGYITVNCSALDNYYKIPTATDRKFLIAIPPSTIIPMIIHEANGDVEGKKYGVVPPGLGSLWGVPDGDTLCYANHIQYSSNFQLGINMAGAVADSAWIDPGQKPLISFHTPEDPFTPCNHDWVLLPKNPPLHFIAPYGSCIIEQLSDKFGNNKIFANQAKYFADPYTLAANKLNNGYDGLYLMPRENIYDVSPWDFWAKSNLNDSIGLKYNPDMSPEKARRYIDTIIGYVAPRACLTLGFHCDGNWIGTKNLNPNTIGLKIIPNPSQDIILLTS